MSCYYKECVRRLLLVSHPDKTEWINIKRSVPPPRWNDLIPRRFRCWNDHHGAFIKLIVKEGIDWSARREWFFRSVITRDSMGLESAIIDQFWKAIGKITIDIQFVVGRRGKSRGYRVPNHHRVRNIASTEGNSGVVTTRL